MISLASGSDCRLGAEIKLRVSRESVREWGDSHGPGFEFCSNVFRDGEERETPDVHNRVRVKAAWANFPRGKDLDLIIKPGYECMRAGE